ncbi:MAG: transaldolase [Chloroflexi bacterium]|nr:transaldolase [Chloroflexota bacterium]
MSNAVLEAQRLGQSIWMDYISREMLESGELERLVRLGVVGVTSNPTIFEKAVATGVQYDRDLGALARRGLKLKQAYEVLALSDIGAAADLLRPTYDLTERRDGYVSVEVSPSLAYDTQGTVEEARRLFASLGRPNVMIKVPAAPQGIPAVRQLISEGVNVNATLIFSLEAYRQVRGAYIAGLEDRARGGYEVGAVASVASFFVSRVDTAVDALLKEELQKGRGELAGLLGKAAVANAKLAYRDFQETCAGPRFRALRRLGARPQRPLWASTSTKNPSYSDLLYVEPLIGPDTVNTLPPATFQALLDHGRVASTLGEGVEEAGQTVAALEAAGVSMDQVTDRLLAEGVKAFASSYDALLANIEKKMQALVAA